MERETANAPTCSRAHTLHGPAVASHPQVVQYELDEARKFIGVLGRVSRAALADSPRVLQVWHAELLQGIEPYYRWCCSTWLGIATR